MDKKEKVLADFYRYLKKERSYSKNTIKAYKNDLSRFVAFLPKNISGFDKVNRESIRGFLESEIDRKDLIVPISSKTIARRLHLLNHYSNICYNQNRLLIMKQCLSKVQKYQKHCQVL